MSRVTPNVQCVPQQGSIHAKKSFFEVYKRHISKRRTYEKNNDSLHSAIKNWDALFQDTRYFGTVPVIRVPYWCPTKRTGMSWFPVNFQSILFIIRYISSFHIPN